MCGVRVEDVDDPLMQKIRYLDKLVDELAKGRPMEKVCGHEAGPAGPLDDARYERKGPTSARSSSVRCMTSVWRVAGRTASRQLGKRSSISAAWSRRTKS